MNQAFGHDFIIVNDVYQPLPDLLQSLNQYQLGPDIPIVKNAKYYHVATVRRGFKEYMAYVDPLRIMVWIEEIDAKDPNFIKKIEDDNEWKDVRDFLSEKNLLGIGTRHEIPISYAAMKELFKK